MATLRRWLLRLWAFLQPQRAERAIARALGAHLALLEDDLQRRGIAPEQARRMTRRAIGGVEQAKRLHQDQRSFAWLEIARRHVTHAARGLARVVTLPPPSLRFIGEGAYTQSIRTAHMKRIEC